MVKKLWKSLRNLSKMVPFRIVQFSDFVQKWEFRTDGIIELEMKIQHSGNIRLSISTVSSTTTFPFLEENSQFGDILWIVVEFSVRKFRSDFLQSWESIFATKVDISAQTKWTHTTRLGKQSNDLFLDGKGNHSRHFLLDYIRTLYEGNLNEEI